MILQALMDMDPIEIDMLRANHSLDLLSAALLRATADLLRSKLFLELREPRKLLTDTRLKESWATVQVALSVELIDPS